MGRTTHIYTPANKLLVGAQAEVLHKETYYAGTVVDTTGNGKLSLYKVQLDEPIQDGSITYQFIYKTANQLKLN